ncbi:putative peptide zinc metalloprotease protein [Methylobacterium sp. 174MFSha1.1]|uniref:site-2 protease family protein n=1 Tax=Methylobacterium sp. 174MFSha1.1 TaxID=1502749 RepID=UPI0008EF5E1D|nr:biotin/lipoyl-binding protein [Methylobacterium sp. 174MFSha1.1]SFV06970.1 putative peptide zinc metalloprotease protein [Methylobacterium sp. 174MFSha1.1]
MTALPLHLGAGLPGGAPPARLPGLRQELDVVEGPRARSGAPTWTLHDPVRNTYFRLGWVEFEILARWDAVTAEELAGRVRAETRLDVEAGDVEALARALQGNHLVSAAAPGAWRLYAAERARRRAGPWSWLLHHYLFFKLPLLRPDAALTRLAPLARPLFTRTFAGIVLLGLCLGLYLAGRQWDVLAGRVAAMASPESLSWLMAALVLAKCVHELGHAVVAKHLGIRVPNAGVAFVVFWPRLYTETTDAWRLTDRRQLLAIDAAGIGAELVLAVAALLLWSLVPDGPWRDAALMIATVSWASTLAVNLNPFMRFDGYYLLADAVGMPNLQPRAFAVATQGLRRALFGTEDPAAEPLPGRVRAWMTAYAWAVWLYRLVLFTTIALVVYHFFIKLVGIGLFLVEIGWFVVRPVVRELRTWWRLRRGARLTRPGLLALAALGAGLAAIALPWHGRIEAPAVLRAEAFLRVFPAAPGRIAVLHVAEGARVAEGDPLVTLEAPEVDDQIAVAQARIAETQREIALSATEQASADRLGALTETLAASRRELALQQDLKARLVIRAGMAGEIRQIADHLTPGRWLSDSDGIGLIVAPEAWILQAYVAESDVAALREGAAARFHAAQADVPALDAVVEQVERSDRRTLPDAVLAEPLGGPLPARQKDGRYEPLTALYRVRLRTETPPDRWRRTIRGEVAIATEPRSLARRWWRAATAVLIRESGF